MIFTKIYNQAILQDRGIEIDGNYYPCTIGKHCIWIPELEIKIPWAFNGKIESIEAWDRGRNAQDLICQAFNDTGKGWDDESLISIQNEYDIFDMLSENNMAPHPYGYIYIKCIIAKFIRGDLHSDPMGVIGFKIENVNKLPIGEYSYDKFVKHFIDRGKIKASEGALGDLQKKSNVINGYLIDVRRTIWDMMRIQGDYIYIADIQSDINEEDETIKAKILKYGQFPFQERKKAYQTYWLKDHYEDGTRQTLYRFDKMSIDKNLEGKMVLDLGCQIGSICAECYRRGARWITGIDYQSEYIDCARDLARVNHHQINYQKMDLTNTYAVQKYISNYYPDGVDIVFMLSMWKHILGKCWDLLRQINFKTAYIESNNCPDRYEGKQAIEMEKGMKEHGFNFVRLGITEDRSPRCTWSIDNV